jgi:hypothetical protein
MLLRATGEAMRNTNLEKLKCPVCGRYEGVEIFWGIPGIAAIEAEQRGELVLAGSDLPPFFELSGNTQCLSCEAKWSVLDWSSNEDHT